MDLYIEHYNDLHNYINDNICKINYNSELLTEAQLPFHTLVINFFKKYWEMFLNWFNKTFKKVQALLNVNEIITKGEALYKQRETLWPEFEKKNINEILDSYKTDDGQDQFELFKQKYLDFTNNSTGVNFLNVQYAEGLANSCAKDYPHLASILNNEKMIKSLYKALLYKLCSPNFIHNYLALNDFMDKIFFDLMFSIELIDEVYKDLNDIIKNGNDKNSNIIKNIEDHFKIKQLNDELNKTLAPTNKNIYNIYINKVQQINAVKLVALTSPDNYLPDEYNFYGSLNDPNFQTQNDQTVIFHIINKLTLSQDNQGIYIDTANIPEFNHLRNKIQDISSKLKIEAQITKDPTKLEYDTNFLTNRKKIMDSIIQGVDSVGLHKVMGSIPIKSNVVDNLDALIKNLTQTLIKITQYYTLSKDLDRFFLFRIKNRI